ncbi:MAG: hypothetical protein HYS25_07450 [Ignavibacteriales bacterium]|nr:hypothetical protein [Ignavibacteriales bacterium]
MDNNFDKVSLGFAEFVSQLLHETFDAVLSAQNYQLEKYSEFEKALSLSSRQFKELYISDDEINEKEIKIFGVSIKDKIQITGDLMTSIKEVVKDFDVEKGIEKNKLTNSGAAILEQKTIELLADEKKEKLRQLINKSEMVRLMVDSGEIRAKLELSSLYQSDIAELPQESSTKKRAAPGKTGFTTKQIMQVKEVELKGIKIQEILDPVSKQKTLIIDRASLKGSADVSALMQKVRIVATPSQSTSNSNLFSEVVIKFKTV